MSATVGWTKPFYHLIQVHAIIQVHALLPQFYHIAGIICVISYMLFLYKTHFIIWCKNKNTMQWMLWISVWVGKMFPSLPQQGGTNRPPYTQSSVVGTTSSAVAPLQSLPGTEDHTGEMSSSSAVCTALTWVRNGSFSRKHTRIQRTCTGLLFPTPPSLVSDSPTGSSDHGGKKRPAEFPRERGSQQTGSHEPVCNVGDRRIVPELHPEVKRGWRRISASF